MVTLASLCDVVARVVILAVFQTTLQELRAPSQSATLQGFTVYSGSHWQTSGLDLHLHYPPTPPLFLLSFPTSWSSPTTQSLNPALFTPVLPAFTCPPTIAPLVSTLPTPKKLHPLDAPMEYRPVAVVHHRVSNPLNPDDIFEFKIIETMMDKYYANLMWNPITAPCVASFERSWVVVWVHMACVLVFWILCGTERVEFVLVELVQEFDLSVFIGLFSSTGQLVLDFTQGFVLELWLLDLLSLLDTLLEVIVTEKAVPIGDQVLVPVEESNEDSMVTVEDLIQMLPTELADKLMDIFTVKEFASIEEFSDEEDMVAVEDLIQVVSSELLEEPMDASMPEPESVQKVTSVEETDSDEEDMAAVEDMIEIVSEEEAESVDVQVPELAEETLPAEEAAIVQPPVFVEESTAAERVVQAEETVATQPSEVSTVEEITPVKHAINGNAPVFVPRHVRSSSDHGFPRLDIKIPSKRRRNSFTPKTSSTMEPPPTWNPVEQPMSPELVDEPVFPTVSELPTVEKANEILHDLLSRMQGEARQKETSVSGVIAKFCGPSAPPPPSSALVEPIPVPTAAPVLTTTFTPSPAIPAAPEPRKIKTFTRSRPTRRR